MSTNHRLVAIGFAVIAPASVAAGQSPAASQGAAAPASPPPAIALPSPPADFVYSADGRRDPFISLLNISLLKRGADPGTSQTKRAEGVAGLQTGEIAVRGVVLNRGSWAALVAGPDGKVYTLRSGDRLLDGTVRNVTAQYVAVLQEAKDSLSVETQREVRKYLRGGKEVK